MTRAKENIKGIIFIDNDYKDSPCHLRIFIHVLLRNSVKVTGFKFCRTSYILHCLGQKLG